MPGWVTTHAPPSRQGDAGAAVRRSRRRWRGGCHPPGDAEAQAIRAPERPRTPRFGARARGCHRLTGRRTPRAPCRARSQRRPDWCRPRGAARPSRLLSSALEQQRRRAADDVAEHALCRGGVLVGVHPAPLLVVGDQPAGQAIDPRFVGACAVRATPAIAHRGPAGARSASILRTEAPPATAARARRSVGLRRDDPRLGHHCAMIRTRVPLFGS